MKVASSLLSSFNSLSLSFCRVLMFKCTHSPSLTLCLDPIPLFVPSLILSLSLSLSLLLSLSLSHSFHVPHQGKGLFMRKQLFSIYLQSEGITPSSLSHSISSSLSLSLCFFSLFLSVFSVSLLTLASLSTHSFSTQFTCFHPISLTCEIH